MLQISFQTHVNLDSIAGLDDVDQCVMYYNQAVMLYYSHQYGAALTIMDKLLQFVEPMGRCIIILSFVYHDYIDL